MLQAILGEKVEQSQHFTDKAERVPVTIINTGNCFVALIKSVGIDGYNGVCLTQGIRKIKTIKKPILGIAKKAGINIAPRFLKEIRLTEEATNLKPGQLLKVGDIFKVGDMVDVTGISKGKGYAGVVKRHHFQGGPKTHGQSDRERGPGSIGQTTTPGRVYKGKRMSGHMGVEQVTVKNLEVMEIDNEKNLIKIKGLVPGGKKGLLTIKKVK